jgi:hypothetical protein
VARRIRVHGSRPRARRLRTADPSKIAKMLAGPERATSPRRSPPSSPSSSAGRAFSRPWSPPWRASRRWSGS